MMTRIRSRWLALAATGWISIGLTATIVLAGDVRYSTDVLPILTTYCAGCHNAQDQEGDLSVVSRDDLLKGGANGKVLVPGSSKESRLLQLLTGDMDPIMPPEGEPRPSKAQIAILRSWIDQGALDQRDECDTRQLERPTFPSSLTPKPITALAISPDGRYVAVGRYRSVDLMTPAQQFVLRLEGHPGKVNQIVFGPEGKRLYVGTGNTGESGECWAWDLEEGTLDHKFRGHLDSVYAIACSVDGQRLATAGYDRRILVWDLSTNQLEHELQGHNGPIFDLEFVPDGQRLVSASSDATIKVWNVISGQRLDTLSQPLTEQFSVDVSPDGRLIAAGGADNRLRVWRLISVDQPRINPLLITRFAHERSIHRVRFSPDGRHLASVSSDNTTKIWDVNGLSEIGVHAQEQPAQTLAWLPDSSRLLIGRMDGVVEGAEFASIDPQGQNARPSQSATPATPRPSHPESLRTIVEDQPNNTIDDAQSVTLPAVIQGRIHALDDATVDRDLYRFQAERGQTWIFEVTAATEGSPLDSVVRILDQNGQPVPRVLLRAIRDSYFTFRGKDSIQTSDFRLHNWEEMKLNQLLYASGEVVKLYHYPRGPDSGFNVYPNFGNRHAYFETTPVTHALQEPCFIVEPFPPGSSIPPNGLPVFTIYFENDDDSQRDRGRDSTVTFTVPETADYFVEVSDARRFQGHDFRYRLEVRQPRPDFHVKMASPKLTIPAGSGQKFAVQIERLDGFRGEVWVTFEDVPDGLRLTQPIVIEADHYMAWGSAFAQRTGPPQSEDEQAWQLPEATVRVVATAKILEKTVRHELEAWGPISQGPGAQITIDFAGSSQSTTTPVLEIEAGRSTTADIHIERLGNVGRVGFGKEEAVINAPHGVYVDDTGLNGVLITESESTRRMSIRAEPWVPPTERLVFVEADVDGKPTSDAVLLKVVPPRP